VNAGVSAIASIPEVRRLLVAKQRSFARDYDVVMEGRDIGSAVFPETPYKFYIDASPEVRAQRRAKQGLQDSIATRDKVDSSRRTSPLVIAEDAHVIDSSNLTVEGVVGEIFGRLKQKGLPLGDL
jgi:cytidylate kinase